MEEPQRVQTIFLEQFPTEILEGIFIHLPQKDLASIATISRRFSDIVEPFLYSEMHINLPGPACRFPGSDEHHHDAEPHGYNRYDGLLERLAQHSKLRSLITSISLDPTDSCQDRTGKMPMRNFAVSMLGASKTTLQDYQTQLMLLEQQNKKRLAIAPYEPETNPFIKKLLHSAPSLQELSFGKTVLPPGLILPTAHSVSTIRVDFGFSAVNCGTAMMRTRQVAEYLFMPSLRTLHIQHGDFASRVECMTADEYRCSPLTHLRLLSCYESDGWEALLYMIFSPRSIQQLVFERNQDWQAETPWQRAMDLRHVASVICIHRESLEELIVANSDAAKQFYPGLCIASLAISSVLKRLAVPISFIWGISWGAQVSLELYEQLPRTLEVLQLEFPMDNQSYDSDLGKHIEALQKVANNKTTLLPALTNVIWWYQQRASQLTEDNGNGPMYGAEEALAKLAVEFGKVGVKFEWISTPALKDTPMGKPLGITHCWSRVPPALEHTMDELGRIQRVPQDT